jgi:hypothetical protein
MRKSILYITLALAAFCASCRGFLDEYSQNLTYVESVADLDDLLVGEGYIAKNVPAYLHLSVMGDEMREASIGNIVNAGAIAVSVYERLRGFWIWDVNPFTNAAGSVTVDSDWPTFYKRIAAMNNIIAEADKLASDDARALSRVKGEAYFLRAWNYFMLANIYGAPYDKANPADGASVTLKLTPNVVYDKFSRDDNGKVYAQIVADLKEAIACFANGEASDNVWRAGTAAAWAMLSRVYLYMEEYDLAAAAADKVEGYELFDLVNNYTAGSGKAFLTTASPEQIFAQGAYSISGTTAVGGLHTTTFTPYSDRGQIISLARAESYAVAESLRAMFDANDMRTSAFFTLSCSTYASATSPRVMMCRKTGKGINNDERDPITNTNPYTTDVGAGESFGESVSIRYAEVVLNKAEALACSGKTAEAATAIGTLLAARYKVLPTIPAGQAELIAFVRAERQKELCFEGHRWFDLRRYAVNSVAPVATEIVHEYYKIVTGSNAVRTYEGSYTLAPYSAATRGSWTVPAPPEVIDYNFPNISNPDREAGITQTIY